MKSKLNFTVGPVQPYEDTLKIGSEPVPYFRTSEFSKIMLENENLIKEFTNAPSSKVAFLTGSGTFAMECAVMNFLTENDKALIINGGSFGHRFCEICEIHNVPFTEIKLNFGEQITKEKLSQYKNHTALIVNIHETSTGVRYDLDLISEFCKKNNLFLMVDAISSFGADEYNIEKNNVDVTIISSQKALACPPGISALILSQKALSKLEKINPKNLYMDVKIALKNQERGQTPFTPAVGTLLQINERLKTIKNNGGIEYQINCVKTIAEDFRSRIKGLPLEIASTHFSNCVTAIHPLKNNANEIFLKLKDEYNIWICPNGGDLKDKIFRVGHIGNLTIDDNTTLINALIDLQKRGVL